MCRRSLGGIHDWTVTETVVSLWLPLVANPDSETVFEEALEKALRLSSGGTNDRDHTAREVTRRSMQALATARCSCAITPPPNRFEFVYGLCSVRRTP